MAPAIHPPARTGAPVRVYAVLLAGLMAVSLGAIFARLAQDAGIPSLAIAAGRLTISALLLTPFALGKHSALLRGLGRRDLWLAASAGLFLAVHFATWITSLEYTSVLISVVIVSTGPLWVALLEVLFLHARLNRLIMLGLGVAFAGGIGIAAAGTGGEEAANPALGALLALAGALAFACYLVIGRSLRRKLPLLPYVWLVYSAAAVFLIALAILTSTPVTGFPADGYFWILLMALFPQLIGHTSFNFALRYLSATYVGIAAQMEPIGSGIAALIVFREIPTAGQLFGSVLIVAGVLLATYGQARRRGE
ncbi:MAG TPA: DMT family transporter [Candidatus Limnocylindrales bacterium]|nr:DMT family transporter [Candidatus Limnocylindrales bacterium]